MYLADSNASNITRSAYVFHSECKPETARSSVHLEGNIPSRVPTWHSLVLDVVKSNTAHLTIFTRKGHLADCRSTEIECRLATAAVCTSRTEIGDNYSCRFLATTRIGAHDLKIIHKAAPVMHMRTVLLVNYCDLSARLIS